MKRFRIWVASLMLVVVPVHPVMAWSEGGHHLIAMLAFRMLKPEEQTVLIEILKAHPQFDQEFQIPPNIRGPEEARLWLVGRAAYWPDVARSSKEYNRPNWHYQLGSSLVIGNVSSQKIPSSPTELPANATVETRELHIAEALELNQKVLADRTRPASERAIAISWIGHLVADAHQPCHAGSLYVEGLFPEGDRGANSIPTKQRRNLHALWDGLLGERYDTNDVRRRAFEIEQDTALVAIGKQAVEGQGKSDPQIWLRESRLYAAKDVYQQEVLRRILDAAASGKTSLGWGAVTRKSYRGSLPSKRSLAEWPYLRVIATFRWFSRLGYGLQVSFRLNTALFLLHSHHEHPSCSIVSGKVQ